jgi:hypothetical protein
MIPRKIGVSSDRRGFNTVRGFSNMAMNKTAGETKAKETPAPKKAAAKGSAAKKAVPKKAAGAKKAMPKKKAGPKLTEPQDKMLDRVNAADAAGFHTEKKPDQKVLEALVKHKVVKRGKKHPETKHYHYMVTAAGKKHLASRSTSSEAPK